MVTEDPCFVPTKSSLRAGASVKHEAIVYTSHKSKRRAETTSANSNKEVTSSSEGNGLNVEKLKQEVARFGMSGLAPKDEKEAKIQWAVKLGAKPPKNKYKNYKLLQEERKKSLEQATREKQQFELRTKVRPKVTANKRRVKPVTTILGDYGIVNKDKIKAVKSKKQ